MPRGARMDGIADESTGPRAGFAAGAQRRYDPGVRDPLGRPVPSGADVILYLLGIAGVAAGITLLFLGMRAVMDVGGMCAEGGPYVIETTCPEGVPIVMLLGIFGSLGSLFLAGWKGIAIGEGAVSVLFLGWPALFGVLGFNFLQYGFDPPGDDPGWAWGWLICGVLFWAIAFGPLLLGAWGARSAGRGAAAAATRAIPGGPRFGAVIRDKRAAREAGRSMSPTVAPAADPDGAGTAAAGDPHGDALVGGLERLAALHRAGSLTDDEYARAKAELLERAGA